MRYFLRLLLLLCTLAWPFLVQAKWTDPSGRLFAIYSHASAGIRKDGRLPSGRPPSVAPGASFNEPLDLDSQADHEGGRCSHGSAAADAQKPITVTLREPWG